ncbi:D-isomer specific 2-hydroxyacid dehydrogenase [Dactylonectria estremocensis]|uniref:D-isomer specific 2-hydroxyacid dehydrogenase n=1 Tax=Dactylonectria estremocensis TaxID=1079267 RepID=A0A9P9EMV7_9HYPO|nr:D-isomer specific 2-hydroxyacid dehydrogenase [Dactylonectria estremocensis]
MGSTSVEPGSQNHHVIVAVENFFLPTPVFDLPTPHTLEFREYQSTPPDQLVERIADAEIVIINRIPLGKDVLAEAVTPNLRMICVVASGTDSVDKETCRRRGIVVANAPQCNTSTVAEHAIGLYFAVRRRIAYSHQFTQASEWPNKGLLVNTILNSSNGKPPRTCKDEVVGILGNGALGKEIASLAKSLGMSVLFSGHKGKPSAEGRTPFDEVIRTASVLIVSVPKTPETIDLISAPEFLQMQTDSVLINVSRGGTVNEEALVKALEDGQIAGAATDVYVQEPVSEEVSPLIGPRVKDLNLITTPHVAWCSEETNVNLLDALRRNVIGWVSGSPINVVA